MDIILSHRQLDFDALASLVAAQKLYPNSFFVMDGKSNPYVQDFLALAKDRLPFRRAQNVNLDEVTRVVLVDTHDLKRAGGLGDKVARLPGIELEVFDHHPYNGTLQPGWVIEPVGACTTLLIERLSGLRLPLSAFEATLMALGIYDDTGSLLFENTTVRDVRAVAYLLEQGANLSVIAELLRKGLSEEQKELLQQLLDQGRTEIFDGVSVYIAQARSEEYIGGLALIAHRVGELEGADTWFLLVQMENRLYLVARSRGKGLAVHEIVQVFGGSGHPKAASATLKGMDAESVLERLRSEIRSRVRRPYMAGDMMSFPVKAVAAETKLADVEQILLKYGHTGVPVVDQERKVIGIISRRDVEKALQHGLEHAPVKGFMTSDVISVHPSTPLEEIQRLMVQHDIGRVPVVDHGKVVGIVSRSDVLRIIHGSAVPIESALARQRSQAMREDIMALFERLPATLTAIIGLVREVAQEQECSVYLVGGFVRDLLLLRPSQDLDFVVEGSGLRFARALLRRLPQGELTLHSEFGTARISFADGTHLDVASTRWEYYAFPGALPQVEESCLRDDLFRRDFTINSMAIALSGERYGELIDYYGGLRDLQQGEIRLLHNLSFIDDPTRMLRAHRFGGRYGFKLAKETVDAVHTALDAGVLQKLSMERFTDEFMLIFQEENYTGIVRVLQESKVLDAWFERKLPWNTDKENNSELTEEEITTKIEGKSEKVGNVKTICHWLKTLSKMNQAEIEHVLGRLRLSREIRARTLEYARLRSELKKGPLTLSEMDVKLSHTPSWLVDLLELDQELRTALQGYKHALANLKMNLDGHALLSLGVKEGPAVGKMLQRVRRAWLEGKIKTPAEEQNYVAKLLKETSFRGGFNPR
ncbi:CBS domain-containing protein [Paradesulfitobacterium ferrireducens]|uniref:CBS domain-containing protein n=1 Tax=Paradesulfitobacterium ferrireducens TaxID=2816476 RepID=UPI001A8D4BC7|nr:CBS domain-containing protein [Paradesulfitobacterium ferrireducens]